MVVVSDNDKHTSLLRDGTTKYSQRFYNIVLNSDKIFERNAFDNLIKNAAETGFYKYFQ